MIKVTCRNRRFIDKYSCIDTTETFFARSYYTPQGTSLVYFKRNEFDTKVVAKENVISIEEV